MLHAVPDTCNPHAGTFCPATQRHASQQLPGSASRAACTAQLLRLQASTVLQTTQIVQLLSGVLAAVSSLGVVLRKDLRASLLALCALLVLIIAVLELVRVSC